MREHPVEIPEDAIPNRDIRVNEQFLREHEELITWLSNALARVMEKERAVDQDAREALGALIRTYRTRESGLIYETRPTNPYAAAIQDGLSAAIDEMRKHLAESTGMQSLRDADVLGVLVFLERVELQYANGRRRGRAFYDFLSSHFKLQAESAVHLS